MPKLDTLPPELAKSTPELRSSFGPPELVFIGLVLLTLCLGLAFIWTLSTQDPVFFPALFVQTKSLLLALAVSVLALPVAAAWLLWKSVRDKNLLVVQRQTFISNQLSSFDTARDPIILIHRSGRIELANLAAEGLFGRPRSELHGRDLSSLLEIDATSRDLANRLLLSAAELKAGVTRELWARNGDGKRFPIEATLRNMAAGEERIGVFVRDVSERYAAQQALQASERQFRLLVNGVSDHALFMINPEGIVTNWNAGAERMSGYGAKEAIGQSFIHFHAEEEIAAGGPQRSLDEARETGRSESQGWRVRKDGSRFWAESILHAVRADDGTLLGFAKITRDISERKRIEQLKDDFVSTVNHELRTPLTSIAGSLGLLAGGAGGELQPGAARLIGIAHANCQRLIRLINDMLDIEKIQSGKMQFEMSRQSFTDVARRSVEAMHDYGDVQIDFSADEHCDVRGDGDRLTQVITNLISNAVKFSPPKGAVAVSVKRVGATARLCVRDQGPGIPDEFRSRIFTKFAQADSSDTRQKGGTGLGLVIAKEIVDRHGGRLWFETEVGRGTSFFVDLPFVDATRVSNAQAPTQILVCEDDTDTAAVLAQIVERDGLIVEIVSTIREAREAFSKPNAYQALLLDLGLPDGDGVSLIRELRASEATQSLPIIVVSAQAQRGRNAIDSTALNVIDWLDKPVDFDRLQRAVHLALRGVTLRRPIILHVEDDHDILQLTASVLGHCGEIVPAESLAAAREFLARRVPDLVILDVKLGDGSGLELLPDLSKRSPTLIPVVIFSVHDSTGLLLPQVKAVMTKSKTSLQQLAQTVQQSLDTSRPATERKIAV